MNEAEIRAIADRQAITDLLNRYGRAMDRMDAEIGYSIWHEDGVADYVGIFQGTGRGFIDFANTQHAKTLTHHHRVMNIIIELDGDRAASEAYVHSDVRIQVGEGVKQITTCGRYLDTWSRRNGRWGIDKRIAVRDYDEMRDVTPGQVREPPPRDKTDLSHSILKGAR